MRRVRDSVIERESCAPDAPDAQSAITEYRTIAHTETHSVLAVFPITGRTHQIRVQLASVGCPLVGDSLYGASSSAIPRHALHALYTAFPHPNGAAMRVSAPLPPDMMDLIRALFGDDAEKIVEEIKRDLC